jgi:hypothetical protein
MKQLFIAILVSLSSGLTMAQSGNHAVEDQNSLQAYASYDFQGKFAAMVGQVGNNKVYLVDFSLLPTRFERVFFMNLSFGSYEIVNMDPTVTENRVRFMSDRNNAEKDVLQQLSELRERTVKANAWTEDQKAAWLKKNDKYN